MREIVKLGGILMLIALGAATGLSNVYLLTKDRIEMVERLRESAARQAVLPEAALFVPDSTAGGLRFYRGYADSSGTGEPIGFTILALGSGYSSTIKTAVGLDRQFRLTGIKVSSQQETPGLGTRIEEVRSGETAPWFQEQFKGKTIEQLEVVRGKDPDRIQAITGATISSRAVTQSVKDAAASLQKIAAKP